MSKELNYSALFYIILSILNFLPKYDISPSRRFNRISRIASASFYENNIITSLSFQTPSFVIRFCTFMLISHIEVIQHLNSTRLGIQGSVNTNTNFSCPTPQHTPLFLEGNDFKSMIAIHKRIGIYISHHNIRVLKVMCFKNPCHQRIQTMEYTTHLFS